MISKAFTVYSLVEEALTWSAESDWDDNADDPGMVHDALTDHAGAATVASGYLNGSITRGLRAYYPFDGAVTDSTELGNDGTDNTSAGYVTGQVGSDAKDFDGTDDDVTVSHDSTLNPGNSTWTMACWVKTSSGTASQILQKAASGGGAPSYQIQFKSDGTVQCFLQQSDGTNNAVQSTATVNDGTWHHIAFVDYGSGAELFVDGASEGTSATSVGTVDPPGALGIGADVQNAADYFAGSIDDLRLYGRALSKPEVDALYARTATSPVTAGDTL